MAIVGPGTWDTDAGGHSAGAGRPSCVGAIAYGFCGEKCVETQEMLRFFSRGREGFCDAGDL